MYDKCPTVGVDEERSLYSVPLVYKCQIVMRPQRQ